MDLIAMGGSGEWSRREPSDIDGTLRVSGSERVNPLPNDQAAESCLHNMIAVIRIIPV